MKIKISVWTRRLIKNSAGQSFYNLFSLIAWFTCIKNSDILDVTSDLRAVRKSGEFAKFCLIQAST